MGITFKWAKEFHPATEEEASKAAKTRTSSWRSASMQSKSNLDRIANALSWICSPSNPGRPPGLPAQPLGPVPASAVAGAPLIDLRLTPGALPVVVAVAGLAGKDALTWRWSLYSTGQMRITLTSTTSTTVSRRRSRSSQRRPSGPKWHARWLCRSRMASGQECPLASGGRAWRLTRHATIQVRSTPPGSGATSQVKPLGDATERQGAVESATVTSASGVMSGATEA